MVSQFKPLVTRLTGFSLALCTSLAACVLLVTSGLSGVAAESDRAPSDLKKMYDQDQSEREKAQNNPLKGDWSEISKHDAQHRERVLALLKADKIVSADDYYYAAMIMQHGDKPDDYVLAHLFACAAAQRGNKDAIWLSAASFDRLMVSMDKPQYFSTQFHARKGESYVVQKPKNTTLLTDVVRKAFNVPTLAETDERLNKLNRSN